MKNKTIISWILLVTGVTILAVVLVIILQSRRADKVNNDRGTALTRSAVWQARLKALDDFDQDAGQTRYEYSVDGSNPTGGNI